MKGILADNHLQRHAEVLVGILESEEWRELWHAVNTPLLTFRDLGLPPDISDADLWQKCQRDEIVLLTANRNSDAPDSLEATIRASNKPESLPIMTIANYRKVLKSREFAIRTAVRLLDYLLNIDSVRGTGRLFIP